MTDYLNRVRQIVETIGSGASVVLAATADGQSFFTMAESGAIDGNLYDYVITDGDAVEIHLNETWTAATRTFSRGTPQMSKIGGAAGTGKIDLSGSARLRVFESAQDMQKTIRSNLRAIFSITDANALVVGQNGVTNPAFKVDTSTASSATGLLIKSAIVAAGLAISVLSPGANENLTIDAKGSGTVTIGGASTGAIGLARNTAVAGTLGVSGDFAVNTDKFAVVGATGNTAIAGTLSETNTTEATSATAASAMFAGGVGIAKKLFVTGASAFASTLTLGGALTYGGVAISNSVTGTGSMVLSVSPTFTGTAAFSNAIFSGTVGATGNFSVNTNKFNITAANGNTAIAGTVAVADTTEATSATAASAMFAGGVGIAKKLFVAGTVAFGSTLAISGIATASGGIQFPQGQGVVFAPASGVYVGVFTNGIAMSGDDVYHGNNSGDFIFRGGSGVATFLRIYTGATVALGYVSIPSTKAAVNSASGALVVAGGVGIGGSLFVAKAFFGTGGGISNRTAAVWNGSAIETTLGFFQAGIAEWYIGMLANNNRFEIGSNTNSSLLWVTNGGSSWTNASDERLKTDLEPITGALAKAKTLRSMTGRYKTDPVGKSRAFYIAQDWQTVMPEVIDASDPESLGMSYTETMPFLLACINEMQDEISTLKLRLAA